MPAEVTSPREYITTEAYLEGERHSEVRHEYFDGEVYAMAGASAVGLTLKIAELYAK